MMLERVVQWWGGLGARERRIVLVGLGVVGLTLLYVVAFEPAWTGRRKALAELPQLRAQLAKIEGLSAEAGRLAGMAEQGFESPQRLRAQLEASLAAAGLQGSVSQFTVVGELIDLRFSKLPFGRGLAWLEAALRETHLRVVDVVIEREASPGHVSLRLTLEGPRQP